MNEKKEEITELMAAMMRTEPFCNLKEKKIFKLSRSNLFYLVHLAKDDKIPPNPFTENEKRLFFVSSGLAQITAIVITVKKNGKNNIVFGRKKDIYNFITTDQSFSNATTDAEKNFLLNNVRKQIIAVQPIQAIVCKCKDLNKITDSCPAIMTFLRQEKKRLAQIIALKQSWRNREMKTISKVNEFISCFHKTFVLNQIKLTPQQVMNLLYIEGSQKEKMFLNLLKSNLELQQLIDK